MALILYVKVRIKQTNTLLFISVYQREMFLYSITVFLKFGCFALVILFAHPTLHIMPQKFFHYSSLLAVTAHKLFTQKFFYHSDLSAVGYICGFKYYKQKQKCSHSNSRDGAVGAINMPHIIQSSSPSSSKHPSIVETDINVAYGMVRAPAAQSQSNTDMVDNVAYSCITRNE